VFSQFFLDKVCVISLGVVLLSLSPLLPRPFGSLSLFCSLFLFSLFFFELLRMHVFGWLCVEPARLQQRMDERTGRLWVVFYCENSSSCTLLTPTYYLFRQLQIATRVFQKCCRLQQLPHLHLDSDAPGTPNNTCDRWIVAQDQHSIPRQ